MNSYTSGDNRWRQIILIGVSALVLMALLIYSALPDRSKVSRSRIPVSISDALLLDRKVAAPDPADGQPLFAMAVPIQLQKPGEDALGGLVLQLASPEPSTRNAAAHSLGSMGAAAKAAAPALIAALSDNVSAVRATAAFALGRIGADTDTVLPALGRALRDPDHDVRTNAGFALAAIGRAGVPVLAAALRDKASGVRKEAASALNGMDPASLAAPAVPALVVLLGDPDAEVCDTAIWALKNTGSAAVPALTKALGAQSWIVRLNAATALGYIGAEAKSAVPALRIALRDPQASVRKQVDTALTCIGTPAPSQQAEQAVQFAIFKYLSIHFSKNNGQDVKLCAVAIEGGQVSQALLQRLQRAGIPARLEGTWNETDLPANSPILSITINSIRWMSRSHVIACVQVFESHNGDAVSIENYAELRVRREQGRWTVLGTIGEWTVSPD
jgi:HEAT repeat protein